jgi:tetratricopeptide (TPR) repeat protein
MRRVPLLVAAVLAAAAPSLASAQTAGDWDVHRDPFDKQVIAKYKGAIARDPHDPSALAKLLEMYRRYRTVDLLKEEYGKVLEKKPDDWAALVVMGRLHHATGDDPRALEMFTHATQVKDDDAQSWIAIGEIEKAASKNKDARAAYDKALAHSTNAAMKKKALRALADLALGTGDNDGANQYFKQFLDLDPKNAQLWIERGDAMLAAGKRDVALESYGAAEKLLGTDPSKRVEVVARRGQALQGMGKDDEAVAEYRRAIKLAPKGYYLEVELTAKIIDIYRDKQALPQLLAQYEKDWPESARRHFEWNTLGTLYEQTGAQDKAIHALKEAVKYAAWELETQRHLITLLENSGRDDEALSQYEAVVRAAPGDARFQLELAERYWRRQLEKKAMDTLTRLEGRFPSDPSVLGAIADLYQRWGKDDKAIEEYERLAKLEPEDPSHLVTLGEQYWQKGDKTKAQATWKRIAGSKKATAFAKLGEVLAEHAGPNTGTSLLEAIEAFNQAIKLDEKNPEFYKGRAGVYEAKKDYLPAIADWEKVLSLIGTKPTDRLARRDARGHLVTILSRAPQQQMQYLAKWDKDFKATPPDAEAGYFLVAYYQKVGRGKQGEPLGTLEKLVKIVPDDQDLIQDLVKAYRGTHQYDQAVALLLQLAKIAPGRERDVYQQISEIKTEARQDDEAIEWAQKALAKSPRDPTAYERLGERYAEMQRFDEAITAYEKTVELDAHNSKASFALAQLYVQSGKPQKATELLRTVLRTDTNDDVVSRAGHEAIDLEEMTDTLGELEKVVSPLSYVMAHKPVYRRVLVELYLRYVPRLVERMRHGNDEVKKHAHEELDRIGAHGLRPLLEALRDDKDLAQQRIAVQVLGHLGNKSAAAPLVHLASQEPTKDQRHHGTLAEAVDRDTRVEALVAAGRLGDPSVITDVEKLTENGEVAMREAAMFALGRTADRRSVPALVKALGDHARGTGPDRPSVQTLACLGLAQIDDGRVPAALIAELKDTSHPASARAACAYAIGTRRLSAGVPALLAALDDNRDEPQRLAAWALGQIGDTKALGPLIRAYFSRAGHNADELVWAIGRVSGAGLAPSPLVDFGDYPLRAGKYDEREAVHDLPGTLPQAPPPGRLVVDHAAEIGAGLSDALSEYRDAVVSVLSDLDAAPDRLALGALTPATGDPKVVAALQQIAEKIEPKIAALLTADDPKVRALAVSVLAKLDGGKLHGADAAIQKALVDPAEQVRAAAMESVAVVARRRGAAPPELVGALAKMLEAPAWADRRVAALSLGRLGSGSDPAPLLKAAHDPSSFVREAVAMALGQLGGAKVTETLTELSHDDVPQVREAAQKALHP